MEFVAAAAMPSAQVGHLKLATTARSNFKNFGDDNDVELSIDLETSIDSAEKESSVETALPYAKVSHQKFAANASCSLFKFIEPLND